MEDYFVNFFAVYSVRERDADVFVAKSFSQGGVGRVPVEVVSRTSVGSGDSEIEFPVFLFYFEGGEHVDARITPD